MPFTGFPKRGLAFLKDLAAHNDRDWFEEHRAAWDDEIVPAMLAWCEALSARVKDALPGLQFVPRVGGSVYRLNRDTRFGKDKSPYKTHAAALLWEGADRQQAPGVYLEVSASEVLFGGGLYVFEEAALDRFRKRCADAKSGERLVAALAVARDAGLKEGGEQIARVPRGIPPEHPREGLLRRKGLVVTLPMKPGAWLHCEEALDRSEAAARAYAPLHLWLRDEVAG